MDRKGRERPKVCCDQGCCDKGLFPEKGVDKGQCDYCEKGLYREKGVDKG